MHTIDWSLIKTFLAIYRSSNYVDAAKVLGIDESTVRRRIAQLERILGSRVFVRREGRLLLPEEHNGLVDHAIRMESSVNSFLDLGQVVQRAGAVRISLIDLFAIELGSDIAKFTKKHPEVLLDITTEPQIVDLRRDGVDVAIRMARPTRGEDILRRLGKIGFGIYCSQNYLNEVSSGHRHNIIALGIHYPHSNHEFQLADGQRTGELGRIGTVSIMADCYPAMLRLCESGAGLATLPHFIAKKSPHLVRFQEDRFCLDIDIWALVRSEVASLPKIRKTLDFLAEAFRERFS